MIDHKAGLSQRRLRVGAITATMIQTWNIRKTLSTLMAAGAGLGVVALSPTTASAFPVPPSCGCVREADTAGASSYLVAKGNGVLELDVCDTAGDGHHAEGHMYVSTNGGSSYAKYSGSEEEGHGNCLAVSTSKYSGESVKAYVTAYNMEGDNVINGPATSSKWTGTA